MSRGSCFASWALYLGLGLASALAMKSAGASDRVPRPSPVRTGVTAKAGPANPRVARLRPSARAQLIKAYAELPLRFELNRGQTDKQVKFLSHGRGYALFLTGTESVISFTDRPGEQCGTGLNLQGPQASGHAPPSLAVGDACREVLRIGLVGANPTATVSGVGQLPGTANYFIGEDPRQWHTGIPIYAKVRYQDAYPGVDLVYYGNPRMLEYDFVVAPGVDPRVIRLSVQGQDELKLDAQGDLLLIKASRELRFHKPHLYQELHGARPTVSGRYVLEGSHQVSFQVASYDSSRPLIIDPVLSYSTYLGTANFDQGNGIAVDFNGHAYVTGFTSSSSFPTTSGSLDTTNNGGHDAFVTKLNPRGSALVYSAYLGGSATDQGTAITVDPSGSAYITGQTFSSNFPTTAGALKSTYSGNGDAFVSKLSAGGSSLVYSTYLGGSGLDEALGIAVDSGDDAYITGQTFSTNFPTMSALQPSNAGNQDAFVTELNAGGSLIYSTYLGGSGYDQGNAIAVDSSGNAYVAGYTSSTNFPTANAIQGACASCSNVNDAFVAEISTNGTGLVYSTYLGGNGDDQGMGIAVDAQGNAFVTGFTFSTNFPTTAGVLQPSLLGTASAFVTQISTNGTLLNYSTYLGASRFNYGQGIAVLNGNAYVAGVTSSSSFPMVSPIQATKSGGPDAFVAELNATASALIFSTFLGGSSFDQASAIAVDTSGNM